MHSMSPSHAAASGTALPPKGPNDLPTNPGSPRLPLSPNQALWEKGDFTAIAATMRESGESLVKSLRVTPPLRALDLGCGDGTTAVPLARMGADVLGVDIARNLVAAGTK